MRLALLGALSAALSATGAFAEEVVPSGKGSYASAPPAWIEGAKKGEAMPVTESKRAFHVVKEAADRPIPTNNWHTQLFMAGNKGAELWADPIMTKLAGPSVELYNATNWSANGERVQPADPISLGGLTVTDVQAKDWSDWSVSYRALGEGDKHYDVTIARGMPYVWVEYGGVAPVLNFGGGGRGGRGGGGGGAPSFFDANGQPGALPASGNAFGVKLGNTNWAVFAPDGTAFASDGGSVKVSFAGDKKFLVFALLPAAKDIGTFAKYAYAIPRQTTLSWKYDPAAGEVKQTWTVKTEALQGANTQVIQGYLPHAYRTTKHSFEFAPFEYGSPRGTIKTAIGNSFDLTYPFVGLLPIMPAPQKTGLANDYSEAKMKEFVAAYATNDKLRKDGTYWGGKEIAQWGWFAHIAAQLHDPNEEKLRGYLKTTLSDWFTYTPGDKADRIFFYYYPNFKGLVGWHEEFWSYQFTDHHFHYGYFTTASALLGLQDPQWLKDFGPMTKLVAKEYANWDHDDKMFPFLRCFDPWEGHSNAGGFGNNGGNNQESSSEAMQAWGGLFLLGAASNDNDMMSAGAMGWCVESQAAQEYWFNRYGDVWQKSFSKPMVGMVQTSGQAYANYFTGDMAWTYGIQLMPNSPSLQYFAQDPTFYKKHWEKMYKITRGTETPDAAIIDKMGPGLGNVMLNHSIYFDSEWTVKTMDALIESKSKVLDPLAVDNEVPAPGGLSYFDGHAMRSLGNVAFNYHTSLPMSTVYYNPATKTYTYAAQNPGEAPVQVTVYGDGKAVSTFTAAPKVLTVVREKAK
jgi:endoglucanase Acf2